MNYAELEAAVVDYTQNYEQIFIDSIPLFVRQAEKRIYNSVQIPALRKNVVGGTTAGNKYLSCPADFLSSFSLAVIDGSDNYEYLLNKDVNFMRASYPNPNTTGLPQYYALFGPTVNSGEITDELSFILAPTPDDEYSVELHYYYYPESIVQGPITQLGTIVSGSGYSDGVYYNVALTNGSGSGASATVTVSSGEVISVVITSPGSRYVVGDVLGVALSGTGFSVPVGVIGNANGHSWLGDNYSPALLYGTMLEAYIFMKGEQDVMTFYKGKYDEAIAQLNRLGTGLERGDAYRDGQAKIKVNP